MNIDPRKLQEIVVEELMKVLGEMNAETASAGPEYPPSAGVLFCIGAIPDKEIRRAAALKSVIEKRPTRRIQPEGLDFGDAAALRALRETAPVNGLIPLAPFRAMILIKPPLWMLANAALGTGPSLCSDTIVRFLLSGRPVIGLKGDAIAGFGSERSDSGGRGLGNPAMTGAKKARADRSALYDEYARTLASWGLRWTGAEKIFPALEEALAEEANKEPGQKRGMGPVARRMVITAEDVEDRAALGDAKWRLPENAIVTDLARETAARRGLELKRE